MDAQKLGNFIATVRKERGMTQADLAKILHVTDKAVSKWERGLSFPDINNLEPLADALEVSIVELMKAEILGSEQITPEVANDAVLETVAVANKQNRIKKKHGVLFAISICLLGVIAHFAIFSGFFFLLLSGFDNSKIEEYTNVKQYNNLFGYEAEEPYNAKMMDDSIFPENAGKYDVKDFKMVYYNPWDEQFLSYLVIEYDNETLHNELGRLKLKGIEKYKGIYSVTGFDDRYNLLAMNSDDYYGFVYALQDRDNENRIIYVELIICNFTYDIEYEKYIPDEYLPVGFNAHMDNPYRKKMLGEN